ncbi:TetR/AcrR family transcriptional regulator [Streptomyces marispadix]|uniref:TetR/AcrR family transcriptional regulator n=1 Tax=Streptomyces marispadix TaxID=2922868 RepID=A0ABS9T4X9_9ACTN|nr:TetR/AcrR family transcriptional regulator [Streptomyces marispadix]MCH6163604.1 TetR/AcrR family transcriptional regulator [Streptomyces marispadix]
MADVEAKTGSSTSRAAANEPGEGRTPQTPAGGGSRPGRGKGGGAKSGKGAYHHGDLRNALISAATDLAREGGPESVVLRAVARRVGVSPTAAYRHFAGQAELLHAVKELGQERLARSMESGGHATTSEADGPESAEARMRALGHGYLSFALAEQGLYRVAFCRDTLHLSPLDGAFAPGKAVPGSDQEDGANWDFRSFGILVSALDDMVEQGRMPPERRPGAELTAWATVHGLAMLCLDGPLAGASPEEIHVVAERAFDVLIAGFTARSA